MAAALNVIVPIPIHWIVLGTGISMLALQVWGSYTLIRNIFRWLALALSAYLYTWQSNEHVEEDISLGRRRITDRMGTRKSDLKHSARHIWIGMIFSNVVMYFIVLSTAATLFKAGKTDISSAADAAKALKPLAGNAAGLLFALEVTTLVSIRPALECGIEEISHS